MQQKPTETSSCKSFYLPAWTASLNAGFPTVGGGGGGGASSAVRYSAPLFLFFLLIFFGLLLLYSHVSSTRLFVSLADRFGISAPFTRASRLMRMSFSIVKKADHGWLRMLIALSLSVFFPLNSLSPASPLLLSLPLVSLSLLMLMVMMSLCWLSQAFPAVNQLWTSRLPPGRRTSRPTRPPSCSGTTLGSRASSKR